MKRKTKVTTEPSVSVLENRLEAMAEGLNAGQTIELAAADAGVDLKAITALPRLPLSLRHAIEKYYASDDLTKAAAVAKLLETLDKTEDEKVRVAAAKALIDASKPPPNQNFGVMIQAPPEQDIKDLWGSVEEPNQ